MTFFHNSQHKKVLTFNRVNLSWGLDNKVVNLNQATTFFLIKLFLAILYKESISNDFQGLDIVTAVTRDGLDVEKIQKYVFSFPM